MLAEKRLYTPAVSRGRTIADGIEVFRRLGLVQDRADLVSRVHRGFPVSVIVKLADELGASQQVVLQIAGIAPATLARRRKSGSKRLTPQESDRIYRIAAVYRSALQLFEGDAAAARRWLDEPANAIGGNTPLHHLDTEAGADEVQDLIGRLEHGVYT